MPVTIQCPNPTCGRSFEVSRTELGRRGRCKTCGAVFRMSDSDGSQPTAREVTTSSERTPGARLERLGRFLIRQPVGQGAFGTVYRAFDPQLEREVALKVPLPGALDTPQTVERFLREAKAAAQLRHPHI